MPNAKTESSGAARTAMSIEVVQLLESVVGDPRRWLSTPIAQLGGRKPRELIGTDEETKVLDLLHAVEQGIF